VERSDTGLGRDAYGLPRRDRSPDSYDPDALFSPDDRYSAPVSSDEEDAGAVRGEPGEAEGDDFGQSLRHPGQLPPREPSPREAAQQPIRPPGHFTPNLSPSFGAAFTPAPISSPPDSGQAHGGIPDSGLNSEMPNGDRIAGRQYRLPNGRRVPAGADRHYPSQMPGPATETRGRHHSPAPVPQADDYAGASWERVPTAAGTPAAGSSPPGVPAPGSPG
jgi:hypothetical protein